MTCSLLVVATRHALPSHIATSIILLISSVTYLTNRQSQSLHYSQAVLLAQDGIEVAYNVNHNDWDNIATPGTYHPDTAGDYWILSPNEEIVEEAVETAKENAKLNNLDNCTFIAGDVLKVIDEVKHKKPDEPAFFLHLHFTWIPAFAGMTTIYVYLASSIHLSREMLG